MDRLASFRSIIARSPSDPFPRYGLAMELKSQQLHDQACAEFARILADFPSYVPAYLMAGETLRALGRAAEAAGIYEKGIEVATRVGDQHARRELESALAEVRSS
jgi:tetratricopeptide (TPR) repeat protein